MSALTSLLVRDQVVSVRKIEEAIQRQVMSGGDLETVLLEMEAVPEDVMAAYRAALFGLLPATRDEVMKVPRETIKLVPRDVALQYRLLPLWAEKRTLVVAVTTPLKPEVDEQLGFLLGHELVCRIATEPRLLAGLGHHYGIEVPPRLRRLAEKLRTRDPGVVPYVAPAQEEKVDATSGELPSKKLSDLPSMINWDDDDEDEVNEARKSRPDPERETQQLKRPPPPAPQPTVEEPTPTPSPEPVAAERGEVAPSSTEPRARRASSALMRRLRGPLTPHAAAELLDEAANRDEILEVFFAFARQFFDWAALFVVHEDVADGREAWGAGIDSEQLSRIAIPLDAPGAFGEVRAAAQPRVVDLGARHPDVVVNQSLAREGQQPSIIVPVSIRGRVVLLLYGDRGGEPFTLSDLPELLAFLPRVADAFQRLILKKKVGRYAGSTGESKAALKSAAGRMSAAPPPPRAGSYRPAPAEGAARLFTALAGKPKKADADRAAEARADSSDDQAPDRDEPPGPAAHTDAHSAGARKPRPRIQTQPRAPLEGPLGVLGVPRSAPPPPMPGVAVALSSSATTEKTTRPDGQAAAAALAARAQRAGTEQPVDDDEPEITTTIDEPELGRAPSPEPLAPSSGTYSMHAAPVDVLRGGSQESTREPSPGHPRRKNARARPDPRREADGGQVIQEVVRLPRGTPTPIVESAQEDALTPPAGTARRTSLSDPAPGEPTVIVDMGDTIEALVEDLLQCGPEDEGGAVEALAHVGEASLPVLTQRFPGPLWFDRTLPHRRLPRGRDISAAARALVRFGERSVPYVASLLGSREPDVRFYATLLASELVHRDLIVPLSQRIFDEDVGTRTLVLDVLRLFTKWDRDIEEMLKGVRIEARVDRGDQDRRLTAIRALGELRDTRAVETLAGLLEVADPEVKQAAHRSLVTISRQDFGESPRKWIQWIERNERRHRIEWLIDALVHPDEAIRAAAGDELKALTQQYYGYHPASRRRDREIAQRKYRSWWKDEGRQRFA